MTQDELPDRIGDYEIVKRLAVGGMAEVFLGRAAGAGGFEKLVAIKRVRPHLALISSFVEMFLDEARIAAKLNHSNIVQIFDLGRSGDSYYIAMEYVPGLSLREVETHLDSQARRVSPPLAALVMMSVCLALDHAHNKRDGDGAPLNIVHRDVSPSNIVISFDGDIKLIDFGIVRARQRLHQTQAGQVKGKQGYISPEQLRGAPGDARSDIFSAGIVLYGLLAHANPFRAESLDRPLPPPSTLANDVPADLEEICLRATDYDPDRRYPTAAAMGGALEACWHKSPFTRLQLAAWMQAAFHETYEREMRVAGLPPRAPVLDDTASTQATIPHRRVGAAPPLPARELSTTLPPQDSPPSDISDLPTRELTAAVSPTQIGERTDEAATSILVTPHAQASRRARSARATALVVVPLVVLAGLIAYLAARVTPVEPTPSAVPPAPVAPAPVAVPIGADSRPAPPPGDARVAPARDASAPDRTARRVAPAEARVAPPRRPRHPAPPGPGRKPAVDGRRKAKDDGRRVLPAKKEKLPYETL